MKENPSHQWDGTNYFGASLASLASLGKQKGCVLVATNSTGVNAFFVREDLVANEKFLNPGVVHYLYSPPRYGIHRGGHPPRTGWMKRVGKATAEIAALIPAGDSFILVDQDECGTGGVVAGRRCIPFLERDGQYWGSPPDDATAIREFERLRQSGATFMVFAWPAFWWLDYYSGFQRHLRSKFRCVLENDRLVVFDLRM